MKYAAPAASLCLFLICAGCATDTPLYVSPDDEGLASIEFRSKLYGGTLDVDIFEDANECTRRRSIAVFDQEITRREIRVPDASVLAMEYFYLRDDYLSLKTRRQLVKFPIEAGRYYRVEFDVGYSDFSWGIFDITDQERPSRVDFETYKFTLPMNDEGSSCRGNKIKEDR